ncbi:MAG: hypothetical protein RLZZ450_4821 [Pseudomonadota bacterium]
MCLLALAPACTDPSFRSESDAGVSADAGKTVPEGSVRVDASSCSGARCDAGDVSDSRDARAAAVDPEPATDAAVVFAPDAQVADGKPAWVAALEGTYAVRTRFYGREQTTGLIPFTHELVHLVEVTHDAASGRVTMDAALCDDQGGLLTAPPASVRVLYPDKVARRKFDVLYEGGFFHTEAPPLLTGFRSDAPAGCTTATTAARLEEQTWNTSGSCTCPKSDAPPTSENDCRIIDADGDGKPGQSIQVSGAFDDVNYVRVKDFSQFTRGVIASNGKHVAQFTRNEDFYVLRCAGGGPCPRNTLKFCPATEVLFEPLRTPPPSGTWTCSDVRAQRDSCTLFGCTPLTLPDGC